MFGYASIMRGTTWGFLGGALVVGLTFAVLKDPVIVIGGFAGLIILAVFLLVPKDRVVGVAASTVIALLVVVPVQNVGAFGQLRFMVLGVVVLVTVMALIRRGSSASRPSYAYIVFLAYFLAVAASTLLNPISADFNLYLSAAISAISLMLMGVHAKPAERRLIVRAVVTLAVVQAIYALAEFAFRFTPLWSTSEGGARASQIFAGAIRSQGTMAHPLTLALLLLAAIAFTVRGTLDVKHARSNVAIVAVLLAGCLATGSRSAIAIALLVLVIGVPRTLWKALAAGAFIILIGTVALASGGFFQSSLFQSFVNGDSVSHRSGALDAVPRLLNSQNVSALLFGNGYYSSGMLFEKGLLQAGRFYAIDNQWVSSLVEGGLVGVALLAVAIVWALIVGGRERLALLVVVGYFFTFDVVSWPFGAAILGLVLGLCYGDKRISQLERSTARDAATSDKIVGRSVGIATPNEKDELLTRG